MGERQNRGKLASVQLLRALAAGYVALAHLALGFADHIGSGLGWRPDSTRAGQIAVALFFVVSGYIMVISSRHLFGRRDARRIFWTRRAVRILPPYWLATALLVLVLIALPRQSVDWAVVARSLVFVPFWSESGSLRYSPLLWPGWTLLYELLFYAVFGLMLGAGRRGAVLLTAGVLAAIALLGLFVPPENAAAYMLTRPVLLVFIAGIALALLRERGITLPTWLRLAALAAILPALILVPAPADVTALDFAYVAWSGIPAILFAIAVLGGDLRVPLAGLVDRLGDMSYALYLLHIPMGWLWVLTYRRLFRPEDPWLFLLTLVAATLAISWLFFVHVERPMTRWLNRRLGAYRHGDQILQETGV
jgi:peptidoglycan/LPS O-acetylase OafA/YrhL